MLANCPPRDEIVAYCIGALPDMLPESSSTNIALHLASCPSCQAVAEAAENTSEPLLDRLRRLHAYAPPTLDPCLPNLLGQATTAATITAPKAIPLAGNSPPEPLPTAIGEFRILGKLGQGGMGAVYKAQHPRLHRFVAIKVMTAECVKHFGNGLARFDREINALTLIQHVHVLHIYDRGTTSDGLPFFVAEYLEGKTLSDLIRQHGALTTADACELARQAALGLQEIHKKGCVHRDIKPGNLMLTAEGLKVLDMGLVGYGDAPQDATDLTTGRHAMGTPAYMAPEQFDNPKTVGTRADVFSLGATLYHLLTGQLPFRRELPNEKTTDPLSQQPRELQAMIQKMLARRPEDRFASAAEVATELTRFSGGAHLLRLLQAPPGRKRELPTVDYVAGSTVDAVAQPTIPEARSRGRKPWLWAGAALVALTAAILGVYLAAGPILNIETPKGTLKIEFPKGIPANAEILVNGTKVTLKRIDGTKGEIVLDVGDRDVTVQDGGRILRKQKVTITRNQVAILRVEVQPRSTVVRPLGDHGPVGEIANMGGFTDSPASIAFWPSTRFAVTSERGDSRVLRIWDLLKRKQAAEVSGGLRRGAPYGCTVISPDGHTVASVYYGGDRGALEFYEPVSGRVIGKLDAFNELSYDISFSAKGKFFLAPSYRDGFVRIWSIPLKLHRKFKHGKSTETACFTADGKFVLSGGDDKVIRLWDIENDRQEQTYEGHEKPLRLVRTLADGKRFVSVSSEGKVIVWELKSGKKLKTWKLDNVPWLKNHLKIVAVASKGNRLLAGHPDGSITVWDLDKGEQVWKKVRHKKGVTAVAITPDGRYALSGGEDLTLRYWRLPALPAPR